MLTIKTGEKTFIDLTQLPNGKLKVVVDDYWDVAEARLENEQIQELYEWLRDEYWG